MTFQIRQKGPGWVEGVHNGRRIKIERSDTGTRVWRVYEVDGPEDHHLGAFPSCKRAKEAIDNGEL